MAAQLINQEHSHMNMQIIVALAGCHAENQALAVPARTVLESAYLDYFNNYISVLAFAASYDITAKTAVAVIAAGKKINHKIACSYQ